MAAEDPIYAIGVAAGLVASHPQTLRMYERTGLVVPQRTRGGCRLYSDRDLDRIRRIQTYTAMGVNLAGIEIIFRLLDRVDDLEGQLAAVAAPLDAAAEAALTAELRRRLRQESRS
jgi:MerR family transcriptional regulator/heat shock protein HspR